MSFTGPAECPGRRGDPAGRVAARLAAELLQGEHPGAEVRPVRLRDCDGLEAIVGAQRMSGTVDEVAEWLGEQAPAAEASPGASLAGQDG